MRQGLVGREAPASWFKSIEVSSPSIATAGYHGTARSLVSVIIDCNHARDAAARAPMAFERGSTGLGHGDKIIKNAIRDIFVEDPFISEAL